MSKTEPNQLSGRIGRDIQHAARLINNGYLVAIPTETVYGLGADATSNSAIDKLYKAKGRPEDHPVIVHVHSTEQLADWAVNINEKAIDLANAFWPGPLTLVLEKKETVSARITGGQDTIAIRIPDHALTLELLKAIQKGIAAPSANKFGRLSPTKAEDVAKDFSKEEVAYILDGGPANVGIESTIVDMTSKTPRILRPGKISKGEIERVIKTEVKSRFESNSKRDKTDHSSPRVPGALKSHYAPEKPVYLVSSDKLFEVVAMLVNSNRRPAVLSFKPVLDRIPGKELSIVSDLDARVYARNLYSTMRKLDSLNCDCIIVESPPETADWSAVNDRLNRAATERY